jgi:hypothetical protein
MAVRSGTAKVTLPTDEQIFITREFDAPKHLEYRAWTTPELVKEDHDAIINSGMEVGMQQQLDLLEQVASSLR